MLPVQNNGHITSHAAREHQKLALWIAGALMVPRGGLCGTEIVLDAVVNEVVNDKGSRDSSNSSLQRPPQSEGKYLTI
jgi:hypothetical protein